MCNKRMLFISTAILSFVSVIFFIIGAAGNGDNKETVESIPWGVGDFDGGSVYLGLQGSLLEIDDYDLSEYGSYDDDSCDADYCDTCKDAGATVVAMCVLSLLLAIGTVVFSVIGVITNDSMLAKAGSTATAFVAVIFSIVAFAAFAPCIAEVVDALEDFGADDITASYGAAGVLVIIGFIFMLIGTILSAVTFCIKGEEAAAAGSSA